MPRGAPVSIGMDASIAMFHLKMLNGHVPTGDSLAEAAPQKNFLTSSLHDTVYVQALRQQMASVIGFANRLWQVFNPPAATKSSEPLKFGVLGAATIACVSIILAFVGLPSARELTDHEVPWPS